MKALVDRGYLLFDPIGKRYALAPRFVFLADAIERRYSASGGLRRLMAGLRDAFSGVIVLSAPQGAYMQVQDCMPTRPAPSQRPFAAYEEIGFQVPTFGTCTGAAWLITRSEREIRSLTKLCRRELGSAAADLSGMLANLREFASQGYAFGGISEDDRWRALAMPLPPSCDGIVLVISLYGDRAVMEEGRDRLAGLIRAGIAAHLSTDEG
ncbi:MAG TPA: hypothetical protein VEB21_05195 [Terriglobales bacterium]|nr:hypothetical protein [Terriglobales bacterium]